METVNNYQKMIELLDAERDVDAIFAEAAENGYYPSQALFWRW